MTALVVRELPGAGAEVHGVDLAALSDADLSGLRDAFARHGLLFFRDQTLSETDHIDLAERWGTINVNRFFAAHPLHPEIAMVSKEPGDDSNIGGAWHTDHSYDLEPALGSILVARVLPDRGGDTLFASMSAAYASLDAETRHLIDGLRAVHSARHVFGSEALRYESGDDYSGRVGNPEAADVLDDVTHPMVIRHPLSGRRALYVNPTFTIRVEGMTPQGSRALLDRLFEHATRPAHVHRFRWRPGSVAIWDNRAVWHHALNDYAGQRRVMHRITLDGCALSGTG